MDLLSISISQVLWEAGHRRSKAKKGGEEKAGNMKSMQILYSNDPVYNLVKFVLPL